MSIHQTSYIIYAAHYYCNVLFFGEISSFLWSLLFHCSWTDFLSWLFGWVPQMKRFALSKERETELEREADLCVKQALPSQFLFLLLLLQSWLLKAAVAQPVLYFHLILHTTFQTCNVDSTHISASRRQGFGLSYEIQYMDVESVFHFIPPSKCLIKKCSRSISSSIKSQQNNWK